MNKLWEIIYQLYQFQSQIQKFQQYKIKEKYNDTQKYLLKITLPKYLHSPSNSLGLQHTSHQRNANSLVAVQGDDTGLCVWGSFHESQNSFSTHTTTLIIVNIWSYIHIFFALVYLSLALWIHNFINRMYLNISKYYFLQLLKKT